MSVFENYDIAVAEYDNGRKADGVEEMVMMLSGLLKKPPKEVLWQMKLPIMSRWKSVTFSGLEDNHQRHSDLNYLRWNPEL